MPSRNTSEESRRPTVVVLVLLLALVSTILGLAEPADAQPRDRANQTDRAPQISDRPVPPVEQLRLSCVPDTIGDRRGVLCKWSKANHDRTRAYKVYRIVDGSPRQLIHTVGADGRRAYFDTDITPPTNLVYGVVAVNTEGRVVGIGGPVHLRLGEDRPEELRLGCAAKSIDDKRGVLCRWSDPTQADARGFILYRSIDGHERQVIARIPADARNAHFDTNVVPGATHIYYVTAVAPDGRVIGAGGPTRVVWPSGR